MKIASTSRSKVSFVGLGFLLLLSLAIMQERSGVVSGHGNGWYVGEIHRKLLSDRQVVATQINGLHAAAAASSNVDDELRAVPSGPDPLHHNGNPKKPRSP